jgi:hypothetical protein
MFLRPNWQEMGSGVCARATFARAAAAMPPNRHDTKPRRWISAKIFIASLPCRQPIHSALMFASLTIGHHFSISAF